MFYFLNHNPFTGVGRVAYTLFSTIISCIY